MAQTYSGTLTVNSTTVTWHALLPRGCAPASGGCTNRKAIRVDHGHGGDSSGFLPGGSWADHARLWCDRGYVVAGIDLGGTSWSDQDAFDRVAALRTLLTGWGVRSKMGSAGWSMGGGTALAHAMLNPTLVAAVHCFSPALDLRWLFSKAGYTPAYSVGADVADPTWATEGASDYPSGYDSHDPLQNVASFRGICPVKIGHATDDATLPYAASTYFVAQVADAKVTMRAPDVTGGHTGALNNIPAAESLAFFDNNWAT